MTLRRRLAMGLSAALAAGAFTLATPTPSSAEPSRPLPAATGDADGLAPGLTLTDLASRGEGDWLPYRIPSLTTAPNGDLLAFFDGRPSMHDPSNITMLMRRSIEGAPPGDRSRSCVRIRLPTATARLDADEAEEEVGDVGAALAELLERDG